MPEVIYDALTPALDEDWDALVQDSPQGSAFLRSDYRWPISDLPDVWTAMNRDKRREIRRASEQLHLAEDREADAVTAFIDLHRRVVLRFGQAPTRRWAEVLRTRVAWLQARDGARLYAARDGAGVRRASVLVLLSRENREAYLWRAGFDAETVGLGTIPALYWSVAEALAPPKAGAAVDATPWQWINFGGSPTTSLGRFKDYLGATPTLHFRLLHRRAGPPLWLWEGRELALRAARGLRARLASHCPPS